MPGDSVSHNHPAARGTVVVKNFIQGSGPTMASSLTNWLHEHEYPLPVSPFVSVRRDANGLAIYVSRIVAQDMAWHTVLSEELTARWGVRVRIEEYPWADAVASRIKEIWDLGGATFSALVAETAITQDDVGEIFCRFPSRVALELFEQWGGESRLRAWWPDMPSWHQEIDAMKPAVPDAAVPVALASASASSQNAHIGRGYYAGEPTELQLLESSGEAIVLGRIINREIRSGREGISHWSLTITDDKGACRLKYSERRGQPLAEDAFPLGTWVKAHGSREVDKFTEEPVLRIKNAVTVEPPHVEYSSRPQYTTSPSLLYPDVLLAATMQVHQVA